MPKIGFTCLMVFTIAFVASCQEKNQEEEEVAECDCGKTFEEMTEKLETNYIGLAQMIERGEAEIHEGRKNTFREKVRNATSDNCTKVLQEYLSGFNDGHLFVFERPSYSEEELLSFRENIKKTKKPISEIDSLLNQCEYGLCGRWTDGNSDFAVIYSDSLYKAYVTRSTIEGIEEGEMKATFRLSGKKYAGSYNTYQYSKMYAEGHLTKEETLFSMGFTIWGKTVSEFERESAMINPVNVNHPVIQQLDSETTLLSIPSFLIDYKILEELLDEHKNRLKETVTLIIDIRGNGGGNAIYFQLIDYFATSTLSSNQGLVLASEDNLKYFERLKGFGRSKVYSGVISRMKENMGEIVDGPEYQDRTFKRIKGNMKNVAILTDDGCISAAESFILHAKGASDMVTTFGSPTAGIIDYTSVNSLKLLASGRQNIYFGYPTGTLHREIPLNGYNETGIIPDVPIPEEVDDKVKFVMEYYK